MTAFEPFDGFPGIAQATVIPNLFFNAVLPDLRGPESLLAFLWVSHFTQVQKGEARFATAVEIWASAAARRSFIAIGGGKDGLDRGLADCTERGALIVVQLQGPEGAERVYFVNNPGSRRAVTRARAGELTLRPATVAMEVPMEARPGIFRMYEEHIGTITPFVGERLLAAAEQYPPEWLEQAFRESAELNIRNWRYIERILEKWDREGRGSETAGGDPLEDGRQRFGADLNAIRRGR